MSTTGSPNAAERGREVPDDDAGLAALLEAVFDPRRHKVLYESDAPAEDSGCGGRVLVRTGAGLWAALGWLDARRLLNQDHWTVLATISPSWPAELRRGLRRLELVERRLLLIVPSVTTADRSTQAAQAPAAAALRGAGWQVVDLSRSGSNRELALQLLSVRDNDTPTLLILPPDRMATMWTAADATPPAVAGSGTPRSRQVIGIIAALRDAMAHDERLTAVIECSDPVWSPLVEEHPSRSLRLGPGELGDAVPWCAALSNAGCHPVLVTGERSCMAERRSLERELGRRGLRVTIVVLGESAAEQPEFMPLPRIDSRLLSVEATAQESSAVLRECLRSPHPSLLYVPFRPVQSALPAADGSEEADGEPARSVEVRPRSPGEAGGAAARGSVWRPARPESRQIRTFQFSEFELEWIRGYRRVGRRDLYLWRWTGCALDWLTLSCVEPALRRNVCETKFLAAMFNVLLDDLIDERHDAEAMRDVMRLMSDEAAAADVVGRLGRYGQFTRTVWEEIWKRAAEYPRFSEFRRLLLYDFRQLGNTVDYSELLFRHPSIINQTEHDLYSPHGMMVACAATLDLMCSPQFDVVDLGRLREVLWHANSMARIGNLMNTWEREIGDDDFSSGVFAHAVSQGWLKPDDLSSANRVQIEAAIRDSGGEREYEERWNRHRERLLAISDRIRSVSVSSLAEGLDRLFASEQVSRGKK